MARNANRRKKRHMHLDGNTSTDADLAPMISAEYCELSNHTFTSPVFLVGNHSTMHICSTTTEIVPDSVQQTMMTSSTTGDAFDDADIDDFVSSGIFWAHNESVKNETKMILKRVTRRGLVCRDRYKMFSRVVRFLYFPLILIGLVTNGIALKVFRQMPKTVTNIYMKCLLSFDATYLVFVTSSAVIVWVFSALRSHGHDSYVLYLYGLHRYLILSARQVIICTTAFMCLDRFLALACPLKTVKIAVPLKRPRLLILAASIVIFLFNSHKLLKREIKSRVFPGTNETATYLGHTELYEENRLIIDDMTIASSCMFQYVPLIAMTVANISLVTSLHKYSRRASAAEISIKRKSRHFSNGSNPFSGMTSAESSRSNSLKQRHVAQTNDEETNSVQSRSNGLNGGKVPDKKSGLAKSRSQSLESNVGRAFAKDRRSNAMKSLQFFQLERHKSVAVIAYSVLFLVLALPLALLPLLQRVAPAFSVFKREHYLFLIYVRTIPFLDIISASINFFVFFIKGGAFRTGVYKLCRCTRHGTRRGTFRIKLTRTALEKSERQLGCPDGRDSSGVVLRGSGKSAENPAVDGD